MKIDNFCTFTPASQELVGVLLSLVRSIDQAPPQPALPTTGFLRQRQILDIMPFSKSTLWSWVRQGKFPAPVALGPRVSGWRAEAIREFMASPELWVAANAKRASDEVVS